MSKPQKKIYEIVSLIEKNQPISPNRLTEITHDWRQTIDLYIRQAHKRGLIHVAGYAPSPFGEGYPDVKLWVVGKGVDAKRITSRQKRQLQTVEKIRAKRVTSSTPRDPLVAAFFGAAA